ncbi:IS1 family transposase [bacterium]|nr:IS1 family transposase [bacterium]
MNKLTIDKQINAIVALLEGNSIRSTERMTGVHRDTIMRLMVRVGNQCEKLLDQSMRDLSCTKIQVDELWCYVGKKQRHVKEDENKYAVGDQWIWTAIDADTKLVPSYWVGKRTLTDAMIFMDDLAERLKNRVQLSSDALPAYVQAVEQAFGDDVDYGQIVKSYEAEPIGPGRYSPPKVVSADRKEIKGNPKSKYINTSYVERNNLTMRMSMRRLTRLTNAFSKKLDNLKAAVALHFAHYNFVRIHKTLKTTPAVASGVVDKELKLCDPLEIVT